MTEPSTALEQQLQGQLEVTRQAKEFLQAMPKTDYQAALNPHLTGSAGAHMRHILDHYLALQTGLLVGKVDYNVRHRHSEVEQCPKAALAMWQDIEHWLLGVCQLEGQLPLQIVSETSVNETRSASTQSNLARELAFVSSHAVHHFSLLAVIKSLLGHKVDSELGLAPATASHLRIQA